MIFSRGRGGSGRHAKGERADRSATPEPEATAPAGPERQHGPYDISEAPADVARLDLGSLHIPAVADVEIRVQANPDGAIQQVVLVHRDSALQLGVFAAPRSEGIWDEVRAEILASLTSDGAVAREVDGEYGIELRATVKTPDGPTQLRFVGVDGPRWMVRGVYQGPAATDPQTAGPLAECLNGLVVDRGKEAKPVREPLPLQLPKEVAESGEAGQPKPAGPDGTVNGVNGSGAGR